MTPYIEEAQRLLRLAKRDYDTFAILRAHPDARLAPTCFHAQQSVEKALKAVLTAGKVYFRHTHDLEELSKLLVDARFAPPCTGDDLRRLTPFAVELRYDENATPLLTREEAAHIASATLEWAKQQVVAISE